jgi:hypothetical protein
VRLTLADVIGGDIDGAWWPYSASMAGELSQLMAALHQSLDDILDISINWSATDSAPLLEVRGNNSKAMLPRGDRRQRLMAITGTGGRVKLLVVPHMTPPTLGLMLLRHAAGMRISDTAHSTKEFESADRIMRAARAESASWQFPQVGGLDCGEPQAHA